MSYGRIYDGYLDKKAALYTTVAWGFTINTGAGAAYLQHESYTRTIAIDTDSNPNTLETGVHLLHREYASVNGVDVLRSETDSVGTTTTYGYDCEDPALASCYYRVASKTIDRANDLSDEAQGNADAVWAYAYDALGNAIITTDPAPESRRTLVLYDGAGRAVKTVRERDANTKYTALTSRFGSLYAINGLWLSEVEYDLAGRKESETDGRGITSAATFDILDRVIEETRDGQITAEYGYEAGGNKLWTLGAPNTDKRALSKFDYDNRGYLYTETGYKEADEIGPVVLATNINDRQGNVLQTTDADGDVVIFHYDSLGRMDKQTVQSVDQTGAADVDANFITRFKYNGAGEKAYEKTPSGAETELEYDEMGRLAKVKTPSSIWDPTKTAVVAETTYFYDGAGNLVRTNDAKFNKGDTFGNFTEYAYDGLGNRIRTARDTNRQETNGTPIVMTSTAHYNLLGNLAWAKDGEARKIEYEYDELNNVEKETRTLPEALIIAAQNYLGEIEYVYDGNGNLTSADEKQATGQALLDAIAATAAPVYAETRQVAKTYDNFDRLETETADMRIITWLYDGDGRRKSVEYPDATKTEYNYNGLGRLEYAVEDPAGANRRTDYVYYDGGQVSAISHANGVTETWSYKKGTKETTSLVVEKTATSTLLRDISYKYDNDGNRFDEIDKRPGKNTIHRKNAYDHASRLESAQEREEDETTEALITETTTVYTYDILGNRLSENVKKDGTLQTDLATTFDAAGMLLTVTGKKDIPLPTDPDNYSASFTYDNAGSLVQRTEDGTTRTMVYDAAGRMLAVDEVGTGTLGVYTYNHAGQRIEVLDEAGATSQYVYDGRSLLVEYDNAGTAERTYVYADRLVGLRTDNGAGAVNSYDMHLDALGSTLEITDSLGESASSKVYEPWGGVDEDKSTAPAEGELTNVLFTGHQFDEGTGFYYFGARYYDPAIARFLRSDPYFGELTTPPSLHKYLYAYANPYRWVDLWGYSLSPSSQQLSEDEQWEQMEEDELFLINTEIRVLEGKKEEKYSGWFGGWKEGAGELNDRLKYLYHRRAQIEYPIGYPLSQITLIAAQTFFAASMTPMTGLPAEDLNVVAIPPSISPQFTVITGGLTAPQFQYAPLSSAMPPLHLDKSSFKASLPEWDTPVLRDGKLFSLALGRTIHPSEYAEWLDSKDSTGGTQKKNLRSKLVDFINNDIGEPIRDIEFFIHGTTQDRVANNQFDFIQTKELFTTHDPETARIFANRTVSNEGGKPGGVVIILPKNMAKTLKARGLIISKPIQDMPGKYETIIKPGAFDLIERHGDVVELPEGFFE